MSIGIQGTASASVAAAGAIDDKALLEYYWKYFELHSKQRMQMINFYITVEVVLFGAFFTLLTIEKPMIWAEYLVLGGISLISLVFWGLDYRTKTLIHWCEDCMEALERIYEPQLDASLLVMAQSAAKTKSSRWGRLTYSMWFGLLAVSVGIVGVGCMFCLWKGCI